jgi:uncharacterized membrane protein
MNGFPLLSLFAFLLLLLLMPIFFGELMATSLVKLHLSPEAALLLMMAMIAGLVNIPVKRVARE